MPPRKLRFDVRQSGQQIVTACVVLFLANIAFTMLLLRPKLQAYRELEDGSAPRIQELKAREEAVRRREAYLSALNQAEQDLEAIRRNVLSTRERRMIEVQAEVDSLAREFNVSSERVQYENGLLISEKLDRMAMTVPLEGGYGNLRKFIQAVESSDKFLVVESVALGSGSDGGALLQLSITLATYFDSPFLRQEGGVTHPPGKT